VPTPRRRHSSVYGQSVGPSSTPFRLVLLGSERLATLIFRERLNYRFCRRRLPRRRAPIAATVVRSRLASAPPPPLPAPLLPQLVSQVVDRSVYSSCTLQFIHSCVNQSASPQQAFLVRRRAAAAASATPVVCMDALSLSSCVRPNADSAYM
jgi:hypothetical protein